MSKVERKEAKKKKKGKNSHKRFFFFFLFLYKESGTNHLETYVNAGHPQIGVHRRSLAGFVGLRELTRSVLVLVCVCVCVRERERERERRGVELLLQCASYPDFQ